MAIEQAVPRGKGMMIVNLAECEGGDARKIAQMAKGAGLGHVSIKVQDGVIAYDTNGQQARLPEVIAELRKEGVDVWLWGYLYQYVWWRREQAKMEAAKTVELMKRYMALGVKGFHMDVEKEAKNHPAEADVYVTAVGAAMPHMPIGLCSYRYPTLHPELPWKIYLRVAGHHYPQVYWVGSNNPGYQLERCVRELTALKAVPVVPVGAAYEEGGWRPTAEQLAQFDVTAKALGLEGISYYRWTHARRLPGLWAEISRQEWAVEELPEPKPVTLEQRIERLEQVVFGAGNWLHMD